MYEYVLSKVLKIIDAYDADEKDKTNVNSHCCEYKSKKISDCPTCVVKLW
jgi:hypothetical protein